MTYPSKVRLATKTARRIAMVVVGLVTAACSDTAGPGAIESDLPVADGSMHQHLRWATPPSADQFRAVAHLPEGLVELTPHQNPAALFDGEWFDWDGEDVFSVIFTPYVVRNARSTLN